MTSAGLYDVIGRRRDVRAEFTGGPIDPQALDRIRGAAHTAPSVGMSQPWDFVLIREHRTRAAFHDHWLCVGPVTALQVTPDLERHGWRSPPLSSVVRYARYDSVRA